MIFYCKPSLGLYAVLVCAVSVSATSAQQLNPQQIQIIRDAAASICNTVKEAKGQKSDLQIEGDVKTQLSGLLGKFVDAGGSGKGSLKREEFEGLSREATATALESDRGCRERVFDKMFDKVGSVGMQPASGGNQTGGTNNGFNIGTFTGGTISTYNGGQTFNK